MTYVFRLLQGIFGSLELLSLSIHKHLVWTVGCIDMKIGSVRKCHFKLWFFQ